MATNWKPQNYGFPQTDNSVPADGDAPFMVKVPMDHMDWGARKSAMPKNIRSGKLGLKHVKNENGK